MAKSFVLDTNIILHDAESIFKFQENNLIIPHPVLEEIDRKKRDQSDVGRNARAFSRYVDDLRAKGNIVDGVKVNEVGGTLKIGVFHENMSRFLPYQDMQKVDNQILAFALSIPVTPNDDTILVSNDTNMRIKADVYGLKAESYRNDRVKGSDLYSGNDVAFVPDGVIDEIYTKKKFALESLEMDEPYPNQCFVFKNEMDPKQSVLVRYIKAKKHFKLIPSSLRVCDITPRNVEQHFLLDILTDPDINLVSVNGKAGSGKTLMALTAAINSVLEDGKYTKILLLKPIVSMDNSHEIGFLPGTMEEKLSPWMASYSDNIEVIMSGYNAKDDDDIKPKKKKVQRNQDYDEKLAGKLNPMQELISLGMLEVGSLQHVRGRSLPNQFIILDEAQNISKHAIKTVITRLGEGSKIVIMGDETQIDAPYLDSGSNALSIVTETFKESEITAHVSLRKSERSALAELAAELL